MVFKALWVKGHECHGNFWTVYLLPIFLVLHFWNPPALHSPQGSDLCLDLCGLHELSQIYKTPSWPAGAKPHSWWFIPKTQKQNTISYSLIVTIPSLPLLSLILVPFWSLHWLRTPLGCVCHNRCYQPLLHVTITWGTLNSIMPELHSRAIKSDSLGWCLGISVLEMLFRWF